MTTVDLNNLGYRDEPFVLANDVAQVFYVKDMYTNPRKRKGKQANTSYDEPKCHIVLSGKRNIVEVEDKTDISEDYDKFHEIPPFQVNTDPTTLLINEDALWLRRNQRGRQAKKMMCNNVLNILSTIFLLFMIFWTNVYDYFLIFRLR